MRGSPHANVTGRAVTGLRRVCWVRIVLSGGGVAHAEVVGTAHRLPVVRRVPLATATTLAVSGVPTVIRKPALPTAPRGRLPLPSGH